MSSPPKLPAYLLLSILVCACNPPTFEESPETSLPLTIQAGNSCATVCGMEAHGLSENCAQFQKAEDTLLKAFSSAHYGDLKPTKSLLCGALTGLRIWVTSEVSINGKSGSEATYGAYNPNFHTIQLAKGATLNMSVFPHEIAHALDWSLSPDLAVRGDGHKEWAERRFDWALSVYGALYR